MRKAASPRRDDMKVTEIIESDLCLLPIVAMDGRIVGLITDPRFRAERKLNSITDGEGSARRVFCCKPDEEVRAALKTTLNVSKVEVEVAGGVLRHNYSW